MTQLLVEQTTAREFKFSGELTRETVVTAWPERAEQLTHLAAQEGEVVFDLENLEQVDTAGLAFMLETLKACNQHKLALRLNNTPSSMVNLAKLSDVDSILPFN